MATPNLGYGGKRAVDRAWKNANREKQLAYGRKWDRAHKQEKSVAHQKWAESHLAELRVYNRARYAAHLAELRAYNRARYAADATRKKAASLKWREANRERHRANALVWAATHRSRCNVNGARRYARKRNAPISDFTLAEWNFILAFFGYRCFYCGAENCKLQQEHMQPLSRDGSHTAENIVPACVRCNLRKRAMTADEFIAQGR